MTQISQSQVKSFGLDLNWLLHLLSQLPPIEIELPGSIHDETFILVIDLKFAE